VSTRLPTEPECLKFLHDSKTAIFDPDLRTWTITGTENPEARALLLAEYCLLVGSPLTGAPSIEVALSQVRRLAELEIRVESLHKDFGMVFNILIGSRWFRRTLRRRKNMQEESDG
jgi:hypothetical protein